MICVEMRMLWRMSLRNKVLSVELREKIEIEVVKRNRLKWLGHVLRKDDGD